MCVHTPSADASDVGKPKVSGMQNRVLPWWKRVYVTICSAVIPTALPTTRSYWWSNCYFPSVDWKENRFLISWVVANRMLNGPCYEVGWWESHLVSMTNSKKWEDALVKLFACRSCTQPSSKRWGWEFCNWNNSCPDSSFLQRPLKPNAKDSSALQPNADICHLSRAEWVEPLGTPGESLSLGSSGQEYCESGWCLDISCSRTIDSTRLDSTRWMVQIRAFLFWKAGCSTNPLPPAWSIISHCICLVGRS